MKESFISTKYLTMNERCKYSNFIKRYSSTYDTSNAKKYLVNSKYKGKIY